MSGQTMVHCYNCTCTSSIVWLIAVFVSMITHPFTCYQQQVASFSHEPACSGTDLLASNPADAECEQFALHIFPMHAHMQA